MSIFKNHHSAKRVEYLKLALLVMALLLIPVGIAAKPSEFQFWNGSMLNDLSIWVISCSAVALLLHYCRVRNKVAILSGFVLLYLTIGIGWGQSLAVAYFVLSAYCCGRVILYLSFKAERADLLLKESLIIGLGCHLAAFGVLIHFPYNNLGVYAGILSLPILLACLLKFHVIYGAQVPALLARNRRIAASASYPLMVLLICLAGYIARFALFPSLAYDDNATHLRMWTVLADRQIYDFDVRSQIWVVAPFAVDLLHAVVSLLAQTDARPAMNLALAGFLLWGIWRLTALVNHHVNQRLLVLALFITTPILTVLLSSLQTELMLALLAVAGTLLALERQAVFSAARLAAILMVAAMCVATKLPGAVLGVALLGTYAGELYLRRRQRIAVPIWPQVPGLLFIVALAAVVAFHSYVYAYHVTGNPVFPLYNGYFKSPFFGPYNFLDMRYVKGVSFQSLWNLFFNTSAHYESKNYVAGFQYLLLLPLALLALLVYGRKRSAWRIAVPMLIFGVVMFSAMQYWRYLFPILPLASVLLGALFYRGHVTARSSWHRHGVAAALILFGAVNIYFLPGINWYFNIPLQSMYSQAQRNAVVEKYLPEQIFNAQLNRDAPGARVLFASTRPTGATLSASPAYLNWYSPEIQSKADAIQSPEQLAVFLKQENIRFVYWNLAEPFDVQSQFARLLGNHLSRFAVPLQLKGPIVMYRLQEMPVAYTPVLDIADFRAYGPEAAKRDSKLTADGKMLVSNLSFAVEDFATGSAQAARYAVRMACPAKTGSLIAQINWSVGEPYYRLVQCNQDEIEMEESVPVPVGAERGVLYLTSRDTDYLLVKQVSVSLR